MENNSQEHEMTFKTFFHKLSWKVWKNVMVLTVVFTFNVCSYSGFWSIQSSLHDDDGLGTTGVSVSYAAYGFTALFIVPVMIEKIGHKWTIVIGLVGYVIWIIANGVGTWHAIIPASVTDGMCTAMLWTSQASYLKELSKIYVTDKPNKSSDKIATLFFGVFSLCFPIAGIISETISSFGLLPTSNNTEIPQRAEISLYCGINHCPWNESNITYFMHPPSTVVWTLVGIYAALAVIAILISVLSLDSLTTFSQHAQKGERDIKESILDCIKLMTNYKMWIMVIMTCYYGIISSFRSGTFSSAYVTCTSGIWMVGLVNIPGYVTAIPTSILVGLFAKRFNRIAPMGLALITSLIFVFLLYTYDAGSGQVWVFFLLSALFSLHNYTQDAVINTLYGMVSDNSTAVFVCFNFYWALINSITYGYSYHLCSNIKLYILATFGAAAFTGYFILEWRFKKEIDGSENKQQTDVNVTLTSPVKL